MNKETSNAMNLAPTSGLTELSAGEAELVQGGVFLGPPRIIMGPRGLSPFSRWITGPFGGNEYTNRAILL